MRTIFNQAWHMGLPRKDQSQPGQMQKPVEGQPKAAPIAKPADQVPQPKSPE